jgi:hypothetical protein
VLASPRPPGPAWLRNIVGIDYLATVDVVTWMDADDRSIPVVADLPALRSLLLSGKNLKKDEVLSIVCRLKRLRSLALYKFSTSDVGWKPLGKLTSLETLNLYGSNLSDAAVQEIKRLPRLNYLVIGSPQATDAKVREIAQVKSIEELFLIDCGQLTDAGLLELRLLPHLRKVTVWGKTKITDTSCISQTCTTPIVINGPPLSTSGPFSNVALWFTSRRRRTFRLTWPIGTSSSSKMEDPGPRSMHVDVQVAS